MTCRQLSHSVDIIRSHSDDGNNSPKYSKSLIKINQKLSFDYYLTDCVRRQMTLLRQ